MKLREWAGAIDRTQHARWFKIAATVAVAILIGGLFTWYAVAVSSGQFGGAQAVLERLGERGVGADADARLRVVRGVLSDATSLSAIGLGAAAAFGMAALTIWLGLGLTYLVFGLLAAAVALPLAFFDSTEVYARFFAGVVSLGFSFTILMQALRLLFSGPWPMISVARNLLTEAVRLKISLVLIVLLILGLAVLPGMLDADQPLRYRVQSFLQYSVTGSFWVLALLTLAFGIASITTEQRDKVIWQTVTKPVAKWEYLLGKWLGLVGLNAILLLVCASGTFLFVEYLRNQPAVGETRAYISDDNVITEDRFILESRVLTARRSRFLETPPELRIDSPEFQQSVEQYIANMRITDPEFATTPETRAEVVGQLRESAERAFRSIPSGERRVYRIEGLGEARESNRPLTLSIRLDAMGNRPDIFFNMTFLPLDAAGSAPMVKEMGLGYFHNLTLSPDSIGEDGALEIMIWNGELVQNATGAVAVIPNPSGVRIPDEGFEVSYQAGSYQMNYLRVMLVLWIKLAFLAMIAVFASTFLSFPVACLVAFGIFLLAEMSGFLSGAAEAYSVRDRQGGIIWYKVVTVGMTEFISGMFTVYGDLKPVRRLVDGRLMPWSSVAGGTGVLAAASLVLFFLSVLIFRRRELAIYSGQ